MTARARNANPAAAGSGVDSSPVSATSPRISLDLESKALGSRRDSITRRLLAVGDLLAISLAALVAGLAAGSREGSFELVLAILPTLPVWLLVFKLYDLYGRDAKRITHSSLDDLPLLFHALLVCTLGFWAYMKLLPVQQLTLAETAIFGSLALVGTLTLRALVRNALPHVFGPERILLAGSSSSLGPLVRKFEQNPSHGLIAVGRLQPGSEIEADGSIDGISLVGSVNDLPEAARRLQVARLVIDRPSYSSSAVIEMIQECRRLGIKVSVVPGAVDALGPATEIDQVDGITVLGLNPPVLGRTSRWVKRGFDLVVAGSILVLFAPLLPMIALSIKLDSPGPVFFGQIRVGRRGQRFRLWKLRTMVEDAEMRRAELVGASQDPNWLLLDHDPRVTRVGRFLRDTSLDEVPQLWNVIRGDMSVVGPRPLPEEEDARVGGWERSRLDLTPGITGLWQVLGRTSIPFAEMVKLDYVYVTNWSLWLDTKLLLQTLPVVLRRRGVN